MNGLKFVEENGRFQGFVNDILVLPVIEQIGIVIDTSMKRIVKWGNSQSVLDWFTTATMAFVKSGPIAGEMVEDMVFLSLTPSAELEQILNSGINGVMSQFDIDKLIELV